MSHTAKFGYSFCIDTVEMSKLIKEKESGKTLCDNGVKNRKK